MFHAFLSSADFYKNQLFRKILSGMLSESQTIWIQIRPDVLLHAGKFFMLFCRLLFFFFKSTFLKDSFRNVIRVSNSLDPDQARHYVGPGLVPDCLQRLYQQTTVNSQMRMVNSAPDQIAY